MNNSYQWAGRWKGIAKWLRAHYKGAQEAIRHLTAQLATDRTQREREMIEESNRLREANRRLQAQGPALERDKLIIQLRDQLAAAIKRAKKAETANGRLLLDLYNVQIRAFGAETRLAAAEANLETANLAASIMAESLDESKKLVAALTAANQRFDDQINRLYAENGQLLNELSGTQIRLSAAEEAAGKAQREIADLRQERDNWRSDVRRIALAPAKIEPTRIAAMKVCEAVVAGNITARALGRLALLNHGVHPSASDMQAGKMLHTAENAAIEALDKAIGEYRALTEPEGKENIHDLATL